MTSPLDNERFQFFLRHRRDIREWAAIEREVMGATREVLAQLAPALEERLRTIDPSVEVVRRDGGKYQRILARHPGWPDAVGMALEWEPNVDPFGGSLPKFGIFFLNADPSLLQVRQAIARRAQASASLRTAGYSQGDDVWPATRRMPKSETWWQEVDAWVADILDTLVSLWPEASEIVSGGLSAPSP